MADQANVFIRDASAFPWSAVAWIAARFPDGAWASGSGALVGPNDVLTASHVVYSAGNGGAAVEVRVYPGADPGTGPGEFLPGRAIDYFPVDTDGDNLVGAFEVPNDFALVSLGQRLPESLGRFGLDPLLFEAGRPLGEVSQSGYSSDVRAAYNAVNDPDALAVQGFSTGFVAEEPFAPIWNIRDLAVEPGDSGSPVWVEEGGQAYAVGVVSTEPWAAPIDDAAHATLSRWMADNDHLLDAPEDPGPVAPEPGDDPVSETHLNLVEAAVLVFTAAPGGYMDAISAGLDRAGSRAALLEDWTRSELFQAPGLYPPHLGAEPFVERLVGRTVGELEVSARAREPLEAHYTALLQDAGRGAVLAAALEDLEALTPGHPQWGAVREQFANRVDVAAYYTLEKGGASRDLDFLQGLVAPVSDDPATVTAALDAIDSRFATPQAALGGEAGVAPGFSEPGLAGAGAATPISDGLWLA